MLTTERDLDNRIQKAARWLCRTRPELAEDVAQEMWFAILERAEREPAFMEQKPAYVMQYAKWRASNWLMRTGLMGAEDVELDAPVGDEEATLADVLAGREVAVERYVVSKVTLEDALLALDTTARGVMTGLLEGFGKLEIARLLKVSPATVTKASRRVAGMVMGT